MEDGVILLVEDDPGDRALTLRAFKMNNILNRVVIAHDGIEAIDYLFGTGSWAGRERSKPSLILLDLKLPKLDGLGVLKRLRSDDRTRLFPVVILTSSREEEDLISGYSLGANSYIRKPVDFDQFADAMRQLGMYWLVLNEPAPARRGN